MVNKLRKGLVAIAYRLFRPLPMKKRILLANFTTGSLNGNLGFLYEELINRGKEDQVVLLLHRSRSSLLGKLRYVWHMVKAAYYMATSKVLVVDDYFYPLYVIQPKPETFVVQVWHACGAFKKFGYSVLDKSFGATRTFVETVPIHTHYDQVIVSSRYVAKYYAEAFNMGIEKIVATGIPRTDLFFDEQKKKSIVELLREACPKIKGRKVILYAPTFRGDSRFNATGGFALDLEKMKDALAQDWILLTKLHPYAAADFPKAWADDDFVLDLSQKENINELLLLTDVLITDYSSVVFEGALLEKPMLFFAHDLDEYVKERDFYEPYEAFIPGPLARDTEEVIRLLNQDAWDMERIRRFKATYFEQTDGQATRRLVDTLLQRCESS
jgi:CDP-ribitol ribitolphosphotransferase